LTGKDKQNQDLLSSLSLTSQSTAFWSFVCAIVGLLASVSGGVIYLTIEEISGTGLAILIFGLIAVLAALVLSPKEIGSFIVGRQGKYGANIAVMTVAFFTIIIVINFLMYRSPTRIDTTATRVFTLAPQTAKVLENLTGPVRANAFFTPSDTSREQVEDLLNEFERRSSQFRYRFIDPELNRSLAVQYEVARYPSIVFEDITNGTRQEILEFSEPNFVTGVLVASGVDQKQIAYLVGHKEPGATRDLVTGEIKDDGFDFAIEGLRRDNYRVDPINLSQFAAIPPNVAVLLIVSPKQELTQDESDILTTYMQNGGSIIALFDPGTPKSFVELMKPWGANIYDGSVADVVSNVAGEPLTPLIQRANAQFLSTVKLSITDQLEVVFFPDVTAIEPVLGPEDMPSHIKFARLAMSTPASWLESDTEKVEYQEESEPLGPFTLAGIFESNGTINEPDFTTPATNLIIFGDSDFARNRFFFSNDNADLFLNSVNWLTEDFDLISIRPKVFPVRELVVNTRQRDFIKWSSWFLPPLFMILLGAYVWWKRR